MDLFEIIRVILGRWKIVIPMALATLALAAWVQLSVPPELQASGFLRLETADFTGDQGPAADIEPFSIAERVTDELGTTVTVNPGGGGYISMSVTGADSAEAGDLLGDAVAAAATYVGEVQEAEQVSGEDRVELRRVSPDEVAVQEDGSALAEASLFLFDPNSLGVNPYQPNASTGRLLQVAVTGGEGQQRFAEIVGPGYQFYVAQEARDAAALIEVLTVGPDEEGVLDAFYQVMFLMRVELDELQDRANVAAPRRLSVAVVDAPIAAVDTSAPVGRASVAIVALGGLITLGVVFGLDARSRRRATAAEDAGVERAPEPDASAGSRPMVPTPSTPPPAPATSYGGGSNGSSRQVNGARQPDHVPSTQGAMGPGQRR